MFVCMYNIYMFIYVSICVYIHISVYMSCMYADYTCIHLSIYRYIHISIDLYLSICL